jgi:AraC-like DNA-binding protein
VNGAPETMGSNLGPADGLARPDEPSTGSTGSISRDVQRVIVELLPTVTPTERLVAARLSWSTRSLQRRLHEEHTTFRELLAECRREVATETLRSGTHSVSELGHQLGFSHVGAFTRAFKRWTGQTPTSYALDWRVTSRAASREMVG